jgi:malate dehydrogenase (oxaloacetate-decarboxylating)
MVSPQFVRELTTDDIQGTGCVTQAAIKAATWITKGNMGDQKIVIFGAGTAGTGTLFPWFRKLI